MRLLGNEPRVKIKLYFEEPFKAFLEELKDRENLSVSQIIERATIEKFQKEYDEFREISRKEDEKKV